MDAPDWTAIHLALSAPFPESDLKSRPGRGGMTFTYVDARAVMDRLDEVVGPGHWSTHEDVVDVASACVRCALTIHGVTRTDFGYPNNPVGGKGGGEEPIKEAASDALRRAGVQFGIARYLYKGGGAQTPPPARRPAPPPPPAARHGGASTGTVTAFDMLQRERDLAAERLGMSRTDVTRAAMQATGVMHAKGGPMPDSDMKKLIAWFQEQQAATAPADTPLTF